jgi:hypothetical protein
VLFFSSACFFFSLGAGIVGLAATICQVCRLGSGPDHQLRSNAVQGLELLRLVGWPTNGNRSATSKSDRRGFHSAVGPDLSG